MQLKEMAPPALAPVLAEVKAHLRLDLGFADDGAEDALIARYLGAAVAAVETRTGQALLTRGFLLALAGWDRRGGLVLPIGPVATIDAIRFVRAGSTIALDPAQWALGPGTSRQRLAGPLGGALPVPPAGATVEIEFAAGHGTDWESVPDGLRQAVLMLTAHYHESRQGDGGDAMPPAVTALLAPHRPARL